MVSVAGGLALTGLRPIAHSYAPFLVERAWEQIKLDLDHQGVGAILVSVGASYDASDRGPHPLLSPGDVALLDTLDGWTVHVPGPRRRGRPRCCAPPPTHDDPVYIRLSDASATTRPHRTDGAPGAAAARDAGRRRRGRADARPGARRDRAGSTSPSPTPTPRDRSTPTGYASSSGTSPAADRARLWSWSSRTSPAPRPTWSSQALADVPHRLLSLGVGRADLHRYGTPPTTTPRTASTPPACTGHHAHSRRIASPGRRHGDHVRG